MIPGKPRKKKKESTYMIPGLPSMGGMEILILLAIILLFFGAKRVPELGRSLGSGIREFRKGTAEGHAEKDEVGESEEKKQQLPR
jgi:sec-independent protein translocase protein TatA